MLPYYHMGHAAVASAAPMFIDVAEELDMWCTCCTNPSETADARALAGLLPAVPPERADDE